MSVPAVRRIVVGVDGSAESAAALRWACREAGLRGAEVHVVHVCEAHSAAYYAVPAQCSPPESGDLDVLWRAMLPDGLPAVPGVPVRTEVAPGLVARVLLERCEGADMLVLGRASREAGSSRSAGPVIRACLRCSPCPVVVISAAQDPLRDCDVPGHPTDLRVPAPATAGVGAGRAGAGGTPLDVIPLPASLPV